MKIVKSKFEGNEAEIEHTNNGFSENKMIKGKNRNNAVKKNKYKRETNEDEMKSIINTKQNDYKIQKNQAEKRRNSNEVAKNREKSEEIDYKIDKALITVEKKNVKKKIID